MAAETLNCPMCGAPASTDAARCEHCGARLATVACPSCFGMIFVGAKFCSHCGARVSRTDVAETKPRLCPRCQVAMSAVKIGDTNLIECPQCEGLWVDTESLEQICADREKQAGLLGMIPATHAESGAIEEKVRYLPCPECRKLMNRVNFAHISNVIVDVCKGHGTWFDRDELRRIIEFIRGGGLDSARAKEMAELDEKRRQLSAAKTAGAWDTRADTPSWGSTDWEVGLSAAAHLLKLFLR